MTQWTIERAKETYNIFHWSDGFFDINEQGMLVAYPDGQRDKPGVNLFNLANDIAKEGLCLPVLVRFTDILKARFSHLQEAFRQAIAEMNYQGKFTGVYPIKVNQQRRVVEQILKHGGTRVGLEAGSKPELMAVLALSVNPGSVVICNGYKDKEYIRLALIGQLLGHKVYIILENYQELLIVLQEAKSMGVQPCLGVRARLAATAAGKWEKTGGEKAKFGCSSAHLLKIIDHLKLTGYLSFLQVLHFHLGSQIANIADIQRGLRECARYYAELRGLGVNISMVDVGGGLAVDYEGTHSRSDCSKNYSIQEYCNNVIHAFNEVCCAHNLPHPDVITESGRAMTAHHALLITNVIGVEKTTHEDNVPPAIAEKRVIKDLWQNYAALNERSALEGYHDACYWMSEIHSMFTHGLLSLGERARAEQIYLATCHKVRGLLKPAIKSHREILDELNEKLADKYFCNFSLFQSLPDAWAINQVFPILPLSGLDQAPSCRGVLQDITCDSDGRIDYYVDGHGVETTLPLLEYDPTKPNLLGIFLVGAYQEILGDLHNLFGDTDSVHVELTENGGYQLVQPLQGDTVESVLRYVQFDGKELVQSYRQQLAKANLSPELSQRYLQELTVGLQGYTYLEDLLDVGDKHDGLEFVKSQEQDLCRED